MLVPRLDLRPVTRAPLCRTESEPHEMRRRSRGKKFRVFVVAKPVTHPTSKRDCVIAIDTCRPRCRRVHLLLLNRPLGQKRAHKRFQALDREWFGDVGVAALGDARLRCRTKHITRNEHEPGCQFGVALFDGLM
jgi:hypothetical protein